MNVSAHAAISPSPNPHPAADARRTRRRYGAAILAVLLAFSFADGALAASKKTRNTLIGVGLGAAAGAMLSDGDAWGTIGGAAAGGLIGNVVTKDRHHGRGWDRRDRGWRDDRRYDDRRYYDRRYDDRRRDWDRRR
jgi:hypothetical protein